MEPALLYRRSDQGAKTGGTLALAKVATIVYNQGALWWLKLLIGAAREATSEISSHGSVNGNINVAFVSGRCF
jgi:hypothetical protein